MSDCSSTLSTPAAPPLLKHIAIIMDGNGRWAKKRQLPRTVGHVKGAAMVRGLIEACLDQGIQTLTLFAFSTENWGRPSEEVSTLMKLFLQYLEKEVKSLQTAGVKLKILGDTARFSDELQVHIKKAESAQVQQPRLQLNVAANYGGRWDIVQAVKSWQCSHPTENLSQLTEEALGQHLSTQGMSDVDLLIRTGGELRISNFLLWQLAYAELYFVDTLWPDFDRAAFQQALDWYGQRERRFGKVNAS